MSLEKIQSKVSNAQKRFRQGRITFKKLQSIVQACRQEAMLIVSKEVSDQTQGEFGLPDSPHEHVHGETCNHSHEDEVMLDEV